MKVALYTRVSTEEQVQEGFSLEAQKKRLIEYSMAHNYEIYKIYSDEGISGHSITKRKALQELLQEAKAHKFNALIVYKTDRLARNLLDLLQIKKELDDCDVELLLSDEAIDTKDDTGMTMFSIMGAFAELERKKIAERMMSGKRQQILQTQIKTKTPIIAYGYIYDDVEQKYIADQTKVDIINNIYDLFIKGNSFTQIAKLYTDSGIIFKDRTDGSWTVESISRIIRNPMYKGYATISCGNMIKRGVKQKNEPILIKAKNIEPIVSEEKWNQANTITTSRGFNKRKFARNLFLFSEVAYCANCGFKLTFTQSNPINKKGEKLTYTYYNCSGKAHNYSEDFPCKKGWRCDHKKFNQYFIDFIKNQLKGGKLNISTSSESKELESKKKKLEQAILKKQNQKVVLLDKLTSEVISDEDFKEMSNKLTNEIEHASNELNSIDEQISNLEDTNAYKANLKDKLNQLNNIIKMWDILTDADKKLIINSCIKKIYFTKEGISKIEFK